jgi:hypothetical protein
MRVGIIQSNFLPWRGYFDLIRRCDLFVVYDDVQYTKGDWRNRNRVKTPSGTRWISVPVHHGTLSQLSEDTAIDYSTPWPRKMLNAIRQSYQGSPHFEPYFSELAELLTEPAESISDLNVRLLRWACAHLEISTPMVMAKTLEPTGAKTDRLVGILQRVGATEYLSGPAARAYLEPAKLEDAGIRLRYMRYHYGPYPQLFPPYDGAVSIIDLFFMTGIYANTHLRWTDEAVTES